MLYNGWLLDIAKRFQQKFDAIKVTYNFDHGHEYEAAIGEVLRELLPIRYGVCRGFIVGRQGERAGDDLIVFDAHRFPTIRSLAGDLWRKEEVPAEAVLAYIEAKNTLAVDGDERHGQSLAKALAQVDSAKSVPRPEVDMAQLLPGVRFDTGTKLTAGPGLPSYRNPYYGAVWARRLDGTRVAFARRFKALRAGRGQLPDAIVAGHHVVLPGFQISTGLVRPAPFICETTRHYGFRHRTAPMGIAFVHLLSAIERIELGELPWPELLVEAVNAEASATASKPTRRGPRRRQRR